VGTLYVVGTPIGNLEDVTLRALRVLAEAAVIAAEDTRVTRRLLARHGIATPLVSCHEHSTPRARADLVARLSGGDVALVTDAGTPGVSDPGAALVAEARAAGHAVVPVPGPSAVGAALSVAGLAGERFLFLGFPPRRPAERRAALAAVAEESGSLVLFEAPHRLAACLADLAAVLGADRAICVARELTKLHEEIWHGTLAEAVAHWRDRPPRGEFTLVVAGRLPVAARSWTDEEVRAALTGLRAQGVAAREAARRVAPQAGRPARDVYRLWEHAS
jgi:16S rRNA (cytidine1402-2'-O)-methyltransferase